MGKLKLGTLVRLKGRVPFEKTSQIMLANQKGRIIEIHDKTYTVLFDDSPSPVYGLTKQDIEQLHK